MNWVQNDTLIPATGEKTKRDMITCWFIDSMYSSTVLKDIPDNVLINYILDPPAEISFDILTSSLYDEAVNELIYRRKMRINVE
jgi:hypothetical protein